MFRSKNIQRCVAWFLAVLYAFAIIFSNFHQHSDSIQNTVVKNGEKTIHFSPNAVSVSKNCSICHFNSTNYFQIPEVLEIRSPFLLEVYPYSSFWLDESVSTWKYTLSLRGPPYRLIFDFVKSNHFS